MNRDVKWNQTEKKVARAAFDKGRDSYFQKLYKEIQKKANALSEPKDIWQLQEFIKKKDKETDQLLDFRYGVLPIVLAGMITRKLLSIDELEGLNEEKIEIIETFVTLHNR